MIRIEVVGIPQPGGSKIGGVNRSTGRMFVRPDNPKTKYWRGDVQAAAVAQYSGAPVDGPLAMSCKFRFPRPKSHFRTGKNAHLLKESAPIWHVTKPDLTKILRSTEDALTGITWLDDSQIASREAEKRYCLPGERPGVTIEIHRMQTKTVAEAVKGGDIGD